MGEKVRFQCSQCGFQSWRWLGRCPECSAWNTMEEVRVQQGTKAKGLVMGGERPASLPQELKEVTSRAQCPRQLTGISELDRVLGGGFVPGSLVLLGGEPGIGKSTLLLQVLVRLAEMGIKTLYVTGEESVEQIKMRATRLLKEIPEGLWVLSETNTGIIEQVISEIEPEFLAVDSIQTLFSPWVQSSPGTVSQVREATQRFMDMAKTRGMTVTLVGHVTKEGSIAGPRVLEHLVDTVLFFEGERSGNFRLLRTVKNRYGATLEVGVFQMTEKGLEEVENPSEFFLSMRPELLSGSVVCPVMQGTRPILVEIQSLVTPSYIAVPRRTAIGIDSGRLSLMLAILEKRLEMPFFDKDVFVNVVGGMKVQEPATDLALCLSLISSLRDQVLPQDLVAFGEVGLSGEVRPVSFWDLRLDEAGRLGFKKVVMPRVKDLERQKDQGALLAMGVTGLKEALEAV